MFLEQQIRMISEELSDAEVGTENSALPSQE